MANSTTQFGGFLTNVGVAQQANSAALGLPWNITHMLIGTPVAIRRRCLTRRQAPHRRRWYVECTGRRSMRCTSRL